MVRAPELAGGEWIAGGPLSLSALRGKAVLLDFFTFGCINCMNNLPVLQKLQEHYGDALQIIGVHSGKFAYEKATESVRSAIERLHIDYPVLNDPAGYFVDQYTVKAWPTMVLIDAKGYIAAQFRGEGQGVAIDLALKRMGLTPSVGEAKRSVPQPLLRFPESVAVGEARLYVGTGTGAVREYTLEGRLLRCFTPFKHPAGLAVHEGMLYIADRTAGSISCIDLQTEERTLLLEQLRSPSAVHVDTETITVAEASAHRITVFDKLSLAPLRCFGNRFEALRDGEGEGAQLAQPMALAACDDGMLWFVDAESSSLRHIEGNRVNTAIGEGLFTYGDSNDSPILLQHPQGIACGRVGDGCGGGRLFIADTYNGKVKAYDPQGEQIMTLLEGLIEPTGLCKAGCVLYIAESGRHRIVRFDLSTMQAEPLVG